MANEAWIEANDIGYNYLKPNGFRLSFHNIPKVSYFCQAANIPGLSMGNALQATPFKDLNIAGDKIEFEDLRVSFIIDENMKNYIELYNWIIGLGFPDDHEQFVQLGSSNVNKPLTQLTSLNEETGLYADATLMVLTSHNNANIIISYSDIFPVALSGLSFDATITDIEYLTAEATFKYKRYTIEVL